MAEPTATSTPPSGGSGEKLVPINIEDEMRASYLDYAMSVIIGRALPDVRDGLKPVHRRVLYAMHDLSNSYNRPYKKSARIVGDVIGKYHPHGDQAVYDTLVRMAQEFSLRHILIDGQGNFGSVDGDPPAAMRYTEVRMAKLAGELLADIEKETVDFGPNYDDSLTEPLVMPTRFPNLLVNGSSGIAVGMATNIPPHNLSETINATIALIKNPELTVRELMQFVPAPDFPTGGVIYGGGNLLQAYETGRGSIKLRGVASVEPMKNDRERIVITEIPYQVNKATLLERMAELVREKRLEGISDLRDESDREGMRVVVELKRDANAEIILNQLFNNTALETSFGFNMVAIVAGQPQVLSLRQLLAAFIDHRREVVTRRSRFELSEAEKRFNIVFGLLAAIDAIDRVIEIIRAAPDTDGARANLLAEKFPVTPAFRELCQRLVTFGYATGTAALETGTMRLNEAQANAILEMRLARLTGLERDKLAQEAEGLQVQIERLVAMLASTELLMAVIVEELEAVKEEYADPRRTRVERDAKELRVEDLIADEDMVITVSHAGYVKRNSVLLYRAQKRGGRGKTAAGVREEDFVESAFVASMHSYVLVFSDQGKVYWLKVHELPEGSRQSKGKPLVNLVRLAKDEKVAVVLPVREFAEGQYLVFATAKGVIKKTDLMAFSNPRPSGLIALSIDPGDELINVGLTTGESEIFVATRRGMAIRFKEGDARPMGRSARGVRSIKLKKEGDAVIGMVILDASTPYLLTVTDKGFGKRTLVPEYRLQGRGGSGITNCKLTERNGVVAAVKAVTTDDDIMVVTDRGMMIRMRVGQISILGRSTQGVRLIAMDGGERVASVARMVDQDDDVAPLVVPIASAEEIAQIAAEDSAPIEEELDDSPATDDEEA